MSHLNNILFDLKLMSLMFFFRNFNQLHNPNTYEHTINLTKIKRDKEYAFLDWQAKTSKLEIKKK